MNKLFGISAALVLSMLLAGCSENNDKPNTSGNSSPSSQSETSNSSEESSKPEESDTESSADAEAISINSDVVWGLGKTLDELKGKYGEVNGGYGAMNVYYFDNGYGRYIVQDGVCTWIDAINTSDILKGSFSVLNYEELASRAEIDYWHIDDKPDDLSDCWWAYFTHPDYSGVTFAVYSQTARDEIKADTVGVSIWQSDPETLVGPSDYNG